MYDIIINLCTYSSNKPIVCQTEFGKQILVKISNIKLYKNPLSVCQLLPVDVEQQQN